MQATKIHSGLRPCGRARLAFHCDANTAIYWAAMRGQVKYDPALVSCPGVWQAGSGVQS